MINLDKSPEGLWTVTIDRPDKANSLTKDMLTQLAEIAEGAHSAKAVVFTGNGKVFSAGFKRAVPPERVAEAILESVETDDYRLRWPVGPDAEGFMAARNTLASEDWVKMGDDLSDEEYNSKFAEYFGVEL